jgi:protein-L-isoaspartate(D-aspartate) O-methyltransferase
MPATPYAREQMVTQQLRTWDVLDEAILDVVRGLPRELFVPDDWRDVAYGDLAIPLPHGQHLLPPKIVGRILQSVAVQPGERALEIGTGSGYLTACLSRLGAQVTSLEIYADLCERARRNLTAAGISGPQLLHADALAAAGSTPPFDVIVLTASLPVYDARFEAQLAPGGRLFVVVGEGPAMEARLISRDATGQRQQRDLFETQLDPLVNALRLEAFRF